jgi:hypothetical protein
MRRLTVAVLAVLFAMGMSFNAVAMSHKKDEGHGAHGKAMAEEKMQHGDMEHADQGKHMGQEKKMDHAKEMSHDMHKGHDMGGDGFVEIGKDTQKGVVATVKVKSYDDETIAMIGATHHVMVYFADEKSGEAVGGGKAALKVKGQDAKPAMLMQMGDGFGADVKLEGMMNTFEIGSKLEDGKKRQFSVMYHNM